MLMMKNCLLKNFKILRSDYKVSFKDYKFQKKKYIIVSFRKKIIKILLQNINLKKYLGLEAEIFLNVVKYLQRKK